ncbi:CDK5RAP3-like protein [Frankliniella fusca]|uniref:CDK5RAP3-like protein n=1 Tax=Frankliniella fusca TaxID=407009 RepID=A0AAE1LPZ4_9NEOP|nr:CDK5RAP3-like protein [Frankliniella fusca]
MIWGLLPLAGLAAVLVALARAKDPPPVFGRYRVRGPRFWIKYVFMRVVLWIRKRAARPVLDAEGRPVHPLVDKERLQVLGEHPLAFDAIFFMACDLEGAYVIAGSERRHHGVVNSPIYIRIPGLGLLMHTKLPDTCLFGADGVVYGAEGIRLQPVEPLKTWCVEFDGVMKLQEDPSKQFNVKLRGVWTAGWPAFNYDTDTNPHTMAKTVAVEEWSRDYFNRLKSAHQSHYEQMGHLRGSVQVDDVVHPLDLMSIRDHSTGPVRDFDLLYRYAFYMMFFEDGSMSSIIVVNQPCSVSRFESGYICLPGGEVHSMEWCDLELWQHGEDGEPPVDHAFRFKAGGTEYHVKAKGDGMAYHYVGWQWEAKIMEMFSSYEMNGVRGRGLSEFHYHNSSGRPAERAVNDPDWFAGVVKEAYAKPSPYSLRDFHRRPYHDWSKPAN